MSAKPTKGDPEGAAGTGITTKSATPSLPPAPVILRSERIDDDAANHHESSNLLPLQWDSDTTTGTSPLRPPLQKQQQQQQRTPTSATFPPPHPSSNRATSSNARCGNNRQQGYQPNHHGNDANIFVLEGDEHYQRSLEPDMVSLTAQRIAAKFRTTLSVLLGLNLLFYTFESIIGVALLPSGQDLILLLLGWFAQDQFRPSSLNLYYKLTALSITIDMLGLVASVWVIVAYRHSLWISFVLIILFSLETTFKV
ncbi:hypothetical protein HK102_010153 [Quaeritorhiza haematococci]|nr:hypothetical protein HK102_010153 [Quaeritorhiza haematococci]